MQTSDFEKLVEGYLLNGRSTLVASQYFIRANGKDRIVDVLALRPRDRTFYLVEVTENSNPKVLKEKLADYHAAAKQIASALAHEFDLKGQWKVMPWIIIRQPYEKAFETALQPLSKDVDYRVSHIESLIDPAPYHKDYLDPKLWGELVPKEKKTPPA